MSSASSRLFSIFSPVILIVAFFLAAVPTPAHAQAFQWLRQFGTSRSDEALAVATAPSGVYVAGFAEGVFPGQTSPAVGDPEAFVARYDALGNQIWVRQFGATTANGFGDRATGVAADATGVYVVGWTNGTLPLSTSAGRTDAFIRKYDVNGTEQWTRQFGTTQIDRALAVAVNATGVYVVGWVDCCAVALPGQTSAGSSDAFLRKYDANGNELFTRQFGTGDQEQARGVAVDASGVYVAGYTNGPLVPPEQGGGDAFLRKYDTSGNVVWTRQFGSPGADYGNAVAVDASGVYVAGDATLAFPGQTKIGSGIWDAFVAKYDLNGTQQWVRQFGTAFEDYALGVAVGSTGVHVVGSTNGALPGQTLLGLRDSYVRRYDVNGAETGTLQFGNNANDEAHGVAADSTGVYICGYRNDNPFDEAFVAKIPPPPNVSEGGVVNTASFAPSPAPLAPGSIASVFGSNLNDGSQVFFTSFGPDGRLVTILGGTSVTVNNIPAPMFFSTLGQIAIQIPYELAGQSTATILVKVGGQTSASRTVNLAAVAPGVFTFSQDGRGAAVVIHQDGITPVTAENPARPGEVVLLYATGLGAVTPDLATGAPSAGNQTAAATTVTVDGTNAILDFSGASPGFVGLYQVNFRIPPNAPTGSALPLVLNVGGRNANPVTIAVGP